MMSDTAGVDMSTATLLQPAVPVNPLDHAHLVNVTLSMFEAEPGEWRLLQPVWDLRLGREQYVASPLFPIIISLVFYVVCVSPFVLFDLYGRRWRWLQKYKIQSEKDVTWPLVRTAMALTAWNHLLYLLPITLAQWVWTPPTPLPRLAPGALEFVWQHLVSLAIFDAEYFAWHVVHHKVRFLYRHVHSVHHRYTSPHTWVTEFLHPWELISIGVFTTTSPWWFDSHPLTQWSFLQFSIIVSVEDHCGYDFPLAPHRWFPFFGGAVHHDMHHQKPLTNFAPFFTWLDKLCGFYCPGQRAGGYRPKALLDWEKAYVDRKLAGREKSKLV